MPRIENSQGHIDVVNQAIFKMWGPAARHDVNDFNEEDPGRTPPIDLCKWCFLDLVRGNYIDKDDEIDHPDYDDTIYQCVVCCEILEQEQDG